MKMINKVILIGNIGQAPDVRTVGENKVANFSVATNEKGYTTKAGTVVPDRTDWHKITVWGRIANFIESYAKAGDQVYVEGKLRNRTFESKGTKYSISEIQADEFKLLSNHRDSTPMTPSNTEEIKTNSDLSNSPDDDLPF